jgi:colanic acid biosynthesis glycosyl transferase WcaI
VRIHIHDFSGHPFQAELSRELAARGHCVEHAYATQYPSGKGKLERLAADPDTLTFRGITAVRAFEKYSPLGRMRFERSFAQAWVSHLKQTRPDCVVACNVPLFVLNNFSSMMAKSGQPWVLWHQDLFSSAIGEEISKRLPAVVGPSAQRWVTRIEKNLVRSAGQVVAIGEEFRRAYLGWGIDVRHVSVIQNWAPIGEIVPRPRENAWSTANLPQGPEMRLLYAGTLGRKHNPLLLIHLLRATLEKGIAARLVVASEGEGIEAVREIAERQPELPITLLPFQPASELPDMLGSADVLLTLLEPRASRFSIPSKVLSSLAAGRPVLGLMPKDNPAALDIQSVGGYVGPPNAQGVRGAAEWLEKMAKSPAALVSAGGRSRQLAVERFGIGPIATRFEEVLAKAVADRGAAPQRLVPTAEAAS